MALIPLHIGHLLQRPARQWLLPAMLSLVSTGVDASMLSLPTADSLSGQWQVISAKGQCPLTLSKEPGNPHHRDYVLEVSRATQVCDALDKATGWRPTPDGITLTDAEGAMVVFFSRRAEGHYVASRNALELTRQTDDQ